MTEALKLVDTWLFHLLAQGVESELDAAGCMRFRFTSQNMKRFDELSRAVSEALAEPKPAKDGDGAHVSEQ